MTAAAGSAAIIPCAEAAGVGTQGPTASRHGSLQILGSFVYSKFRRLRPVKTEVLLVDGRASVSNCLLSFLYGTVFNGHSMLPSSCCTGRACFLLDTPAAWQLRVSKDGPSKAPCFNTDPCDSAGTALGRSWGDVDTPTLVGGFSPVMMH